MKTTSKMIVTSIIAMSSLTSCSFILDHTMKNRRNYEWYGACPLKGELSSYGIPSVYYVGFVNLKDVIIFSDDNQYYLTTLRVLKDTTAMIDLKEREGVFRLQRPPGRASDGYINFIKEYAGRRNDFKLEKLLLDNLYVDFKSSLIPLEIESKYALYSFKYHPTRFLLSLQNKEENLIYMHRGSFDYIADVEKRNLFFTQLLPIYEKKDLKRLPIDECLHSITETIIYF